MRNTVLRACLVVALVLWSSIASAEDCWVNDCWADAGADDAFEPGECEPGDGCFLDPCTDNNNCMSGWCVDHMGEAMLPTSTASARASGSARKTA